MRFQGAVTCGQRVTFAVVAVKALACRDGLERGGPTAPQHIRSPRLS